MGTILLGETTKKTFVEEHIVTYHKDPLDDVSGNDKDSPSKKIPKDTQ